MSIKIEKLEGNFEAFVDPISGLILEGKNFVDMSTSLYPPFYNSKKIKNAIETGAQKVSRFRILLDKESNIDELKKEVPWLFELENKYPDTVKIAKTAEDITHHILIDEKYFRIEAKHKPDKNRKLKLKNLIVKNPPRVIVLQLVRQFDNWWKNAKRIDI